MRGMVTGDQKRSPTPKLGPIGDQCHHAWYDGKQSHVCRLQKGHPPPHRCSKDTCNAKDNS